MENHSKCQRIKGTRKQAELLDASTDERTRIKATCYVQIRLEPDRYTMRTFTLLAASVSLLGPVTAQVTLLSEDFGSVTPSPGWSWLGNAPLWGPDAVFKESLDQCVTPPPGGAPALLFHPLPYDPTWTYQISVSMLVVGPGSGSAMAYCGLAWVDMTTGSLDHAGVDATSFSQFPNWETGSSIASTAYGNSVGPNAQFGIMLTVDPSAVNAQAGFGGLVVIATSPLALRLQPKLWLDGAYDQGTGLMRTDLRTAGLIPLNEPNSAMFGGSGGEVLFPQILSTPGTNAAVDWVRIELRATVNGPTVAVCNAMLQRDGDVVAINGVPSLALNAPAGSYYVIARHRNHLAVRTAAPIALSPTPTSIDFRSPSTALYVRPAPNTDLPVKSIGNQRLLWAGNTVTDDRVKYTGANNDRDFILTAIGGVVPTATVTGQYRMEDVNLDGVVKYTGTGNDRDVILQTIGGTVPTAVRVEQVQ